MRRHAIGVILAVGMVMGHGLVFAGPPRVLTFEERVEAQRKIEQVLWNHRIWPAENPGPKPPLSAVLPEEALRARVETYVKESASLAELWNLRFPRIEAAQTDALLAPRSIPA